MMNFKKSRVGAAIVGDMIEPLLCKDGANTVDTSVISYDQVPSSDREATATKLTQEQLLNLVVICLVTTLGVVASVSTIILVPTTITIAAGCICLLISPIVIFTAKKMLVLPALRIDVDKLQHTKMRLEKERERLVKEVQTLEACERRYAGMERQLQHIALSQSTNVLAVLGLVRQHEETLELMRENLRQKVIEDIIGILIRHDSSTHRIDKVEAHLLSLKISVKLEAYGVSFDETKFLQAVALNPTYEGVIGTTRKLLPLDNEMYDEEEFSDMYDMYFIASTEDGSTIWASTASFASFPSRENGISLARTVRRPSYRRAYTLGNLNV